MDGTLSAAADSQNIAGRPERLKVWRDGAPDPLTEGLAQLDGYLAGLGLDWGWLVIFDRRAGQPPMAERTASQQAQSPQGRCIEVVCA
ncbi:hypothetical protein [uncultured Thiodictyon sp.]|uniref:hypothetical protein n=1 Tax=uncultured Thiodictyon sp. TaxID=1846217 RepID=UPI0025DC39A2|nr:hypothetical protein [uncultured Thiodictyon sp.]